MSRLFTVYAHVFPNGKIYIGITSQPVNRRWRKGLAYASNVRMTRAIAKHGWDNIEHRILFEGLSQDAAEKIEIALIERLNLQNTSRGYNLARGGTHPPHSDETRAKIGRKSQGRKHSEDFKKWVSEINSGQNNYMYGRKHTEETKQKISKAKRGKSPKVNEGLFGSSHPSSKAVIALDKSTNEPVYKFGSIVEASQTLNVSKSCLQDALHGRQKTSAGYVWEYE